MTDRNLEIIDMTFDTVTDGLGWALVFLLWLQMLIF